MSKLRHLGFDARYIRVDHHDGISRFSARIGSALWSIVEKNGDWEVTFLISDERQRAHLPADARCVMVSSPTSMREPFIARMLNPLNFDVVYSPMQTMGSRSRAYRLVLTVHDLIYYSHPMPPRQFNPLIRLGWRLYHLTWAPQRALLNSADVIVAVSETTRSLISRFRLTRRPTHVVYNATDLSSSPHSQTKSAFDGREKSLIYMGSFLPYKNVEALIRVANEAPDYTLHLLSRIHERDQAALSGLIENGNVVFHNGVSDEEYVELLMRSHALVTLSLDEGFGIPVIEAMALGTPVICSDLEIFREIGADAPVFVDPLSVPSAISAIRYLEQKDVWIRHSQLGFNQSALFDWDKSAQKLFDVLNQSLDVEPPR